MKAWSLAHPGGALTLIDRPVPEADPGTVLIDMKAVPLLGYTDAFLKGQLPYWTPSRPFIPGTNGVGIVKAVGADVHHVVPGQRVLVEPHLRAAEPVAEPAQILIGLTGMSPDSGAMLDRWGDGTWAETLRFPASCVYALNGMDQIADTEAAILSKFAIPLGGLRRAGFAAGETLIVHGATGYFASAAVLLGLAMGAERVVAAARNEAGLQKLVAAGGDRVVPVVMTGDVEADTTALRHAAGGGAAVGFDMVGGASSSNGTKAVLSSLNRFGKLILMGSMTTQLELDYMQLLASDLSIIGNFMFAPADMRALLGLVRSGQLSLASVETESFAFDELHAGIAHAASMKGLQATVLTISA